MQRAAAGHYVAVGHRSPVFKLSAPQNEPLTVRVDALAVIDHDLELVDGGLRGDGEGGLTACEGLNVDVVERVVGGGRYLWSSARLLNDEGVEQGTLLIRELHHRLRRMGRVSGACATRAYANGKAMMAIAHVPRLLHPGDLFLFAALVLNFLVSISLPYLTALDVARATFKTDAHVGGVNAAREVRFGVWASCVYADDGTKTCLKAGPAYSVGFEDPDQDVNVVIGPSWTRGLVVHPIATGITFLALLCSFSLHIAVSLVASLLSFLAALLTLVAFAIDIALFVYVKHQADKLPSVDGSGKPGPVQVLLRVLLRLSFLSHSRRLRAPAPGGCTVCFGRRRQRMSTATSYPMTETNTARAPFWKRFRRSA
ncbi:SUR7/PalI family-domain-containing protein [Schizophyllum amplum]|uniref:SUR7/PalI family-domain-containing protein n=1 Tax=Schizophyllum amplum TaxID=97359 RepID=A0A550CEI5_9AGAR|nr:SUR7/PalI family-domain-containing protein [Auriculariopsis ampla]